MTYQKGDLVLISDGTITSTCIILTEMFEVTLDKQNFYYTYCLESGHYGVVYEPEIVSLVAKDFAPDFEFHSEVFDTDYAWYEYFFDQFAYYPMIYPSGSFP